MKKEEILILNREDLIENNINKEFDLIDFYDFKISNYPMVKVSIIIFIDENGETKILKNRYGNKGKESNISGYFSFSRYLDRNFDYYDNTDNGDIYKDKNEIKFYTEEEIFNKWLNSKNMTLKPTPPKDREVHLFGFSK